MRALSKSKIMAFRQCPKRLWLEVHRSELINYSTSTQASFEVGHQVGAIAQYIYDPEKSGVVIDIKTEGFKQAFIRTKDSLSLDFPIFEAGFSINGALAFADVMLPVNQNGVKSWRMIEVKSSTNAYEYHREDIAIQTYIAQQSGVNLSSVSLAHIDSTWTYPGKLNYFGLLKEVDLTEESFARGNEVKRWIADAQKVVQSKEPEIQAGDQCHTPFDCGFYEYCTRHEVKAEFPISWLPRFSSKNTKELKDSGIHDLRDVPDSLLNDVQKLVKEHTIQNTAYFDIEGSRNIISSFSLPAYFLDFETIQFPVPIWEGTRPYQQITFQFSLHSLKESGELSHEEFLDLSGDNPSRSLAKALINACGIDGPIFIYNAGFETARIRELGERHQEYKEKLLAINNRVVDLLPIARNHYYHPSQQGSWSIKKVLPALVPELNYANLEGVQDGGMAMNAFLEAIKPNTAQVRKENLQHQLLEYCKLDTYAMVRLWEALQNRSVEKITQNNF
ncbi:DUF2779 domain-containing protein [Methylotenera sp.]|uniref:DUF2779 domain-containing protein n=1 Tax=Methylotenera sp. TaxID=2051956 RepID=UPI002732C6BA|nr:DUF2779 domain-containing protein [Methylotenera sp.]MDP3211920.1 DUF2779 domain-containing protein [Methylotenera sp.]